MKNSSYMDKALRSNDPRYARVLSKLGYDRRDMVAAPIKAAPQPDETAALRADYERIVGKRPFMGWDAEMLRAKIAEARAA